MKKGFFFNLLAFLAEILPPLVVLLRPKKDDDVVN
jgi:hypothetical protein